MSRDEKREQLGRDLMTAMQLLEYALHLRQWGERAPGGSETWAEFDRRCETFLRQMAGVSLTMSAAQIEQAFRLPPGSVVLDRPAEEPKPGDPFRVYADIERVPRGFRVTLTEARPS